MQSLREFFGTRRNLISVAVLVFIALTLPLALYLVKQQQTFRSNASGELIQLAEGNCITTVNGVKSATCNTIPLKLTNPFGLSTSQPSSTISASPTSVASTGTSTSPSPAASSNVFITPGPVIKVNGFTSVAIQAALDQVKASGGSVYAPTGTYNVTEKIRVFSNVTFFGDGIDKTILKLDASLLQNEDGILANDTNYGHTNIVVRDMTLQGLGQESGLLQCCVGIKLRQLEKGLLYNIKVDGFSWHGIWLIYKKQTASSAGLDTVKNVRISNSQITNNKGSGVSLDSPSSENVIDNSVFTGNNSGTGEDNYLKSGGAISLLMDEDGAVGKNKILNNTIINNGYRGISNMARNGITTIAQKVIPNNAFCNNIVENNGDIGIVDANSEDSIYIANKINNNPGGVNGKVFTGSFRYYDQSIPRWDTVPGNTSTAMIEDESAGATNADCKVIEKLNNIPPAPTKPAAAKPTMSWFAFLPHFTVFGDDDNTGCNNGPCEQTPAASPSPSVTASVQASAVVGATPSSTASASLLPSFSPTASASASASTAPSGNSYRLSETQSGLAQASWVSFTGSTIVANFTVSAAPGAKQIWVEYRNSGNQTLTDHISFTMLAPTPVISNINCSLDIINKNVKVTVTGTNLGAEKGTITANTSAVEISSWSDTAITGLIKGSGETGQKYTLGFKRADSMIAPTQTCEVNVSSLSVGAKVFCRENSATDVTSVKVALFSPDAPEKKIEETAVIDKDGILQGLKTKLSAGTPYIISLKAPYSVRRNASFTGMEGTTIINGPDGKPFVLPIGDISPAAGDGQINALDRAELVKQWRILDSSASAVLTGDFNRDKKVNSVDWACMKYDFNAKDDAPDSAGSGNSRGAGNGQVQQGQSSAIFTLQ